MPVPSPSSDQKVWAVLGPTNTGKTHLAVERMLAHPSGMIGLPLRLLAREIYERVVRAKGAAQTALVTGEERIVPPGARWFVATVEAMPLDRPVSFLCVDEIQLAGDPDRGHIFTDRLLHARGTAETMFLGSDRIRGLARALVPGLFVDRRERLSTLTHTGSRKITRLPRRSAIVAFSSAEVYAIAELIRRHRGGAAVVMGALSPRTRNAQVALFQSGEVDFLVATDAIGMGLNLEVDHVAFASLAKFDGRTHRPLRADEIAQIAGRAGRFRNDGTFGETADCADIDPETIERVERHEFEPLDALEWRASTLDFASAPALMASLDAAPPHPSLRRMRGAVDEETFRRLSVADWARGPLSSRAGVRRLWDACLLPDFRRAPLDEHVALVDSLARHLTGPGGRVPSGWFARRVAELDRADGDIEQLHDRLASIRIWTYAANRADWVEDADRWRAETRAVEDRLSDMLHERLMQRFIDRRTSALLKGLKRESVMSVTVSPDGGVEVEGHHLGRLEGLRFTLDPEARGLEEKALKTAALQALRPELAARLMALITAPDTALTLTDAGEIAWEGHAVAALVPRQPLMTPRATLLGGELGPDELRRQAGVRVDTWLATLAARDLAPLSVLAAAAQGETMNGAARAIAFQVAEAGGVLDRAAIGGDIARLTQEERHALRQAGLRFGRAAVYLPALLKPRPARLHALLAFHAEGRSGVPFLPPPGLTSLDADPAVPAADFARAGFRSLGGRAVRLDILDRVADSLFEAAATAKGPCPLPLAAVSLLGASVETAEAVVTALGWQKETGEDGVSLWKPARAPRPARSEGGRPRRDRPEADTPRGERPRPDRPRGERPAGARRPAPGGPHPTRFEAKPETPARAIDPSSPFAALMSLREAMSPPAPAPRRDKPKKKKRPDGPRVADGAGAGVPEADVPVAAVESGAVEPAAPETAPVADPAG